MAARGIYLSLALAFALVLLNISCCTCKNVDNSNIKGSLTKDEANKVYSNLKSLVKGINPSAKYNAGRLFYKYLNINGKGVLIRLTRLSSDCSVSTSETIQGRQLVDPFNQLLNEIQPLLSVGYKWAAVTIAKDWIDYYVTDLYSGDSAAEPRAFKFSYKPQAKGTNDCPISPGFLLSHSDFNLLNPGDSLLSPNGNYKLTIPSSPTNCVLNLQGGDGGIIWHSVSGDSPTYQDNCYLNFGSTGTLELWNGGEVIWHDVSLCSPRNECIGTASLVVEDSGDAKVYRSVDDHLAFYWSATNTNQ